MTIMSGDGKPIPPESWGGDLQGMDGVSPARPQMRCADCGTPIPFGKFCPQHLEEARAKNSEALQKAIEADPKAAERFAKASKEAPEKAREDMSVTMAKAAERAQAIVTPGATVERDQTNHLEKSGPPVDTTQTVGINAGQMSQAGVNEAPSGLVLPAAAQDRVRLTRRSDDFLIGQAVGWLAELRAMAEEGKVGRESAAEILQLAAELTYALAGILK